MNIFDFVLTFSENMRFSCYFCREIKVFGRGRVSLVIEIALGTTAGEWWHIAEHLSKKYTVLLYERSKNARIERTPLNIANELHELLKNIPCEEQLIIAAHSQGGLYAQQFVRLYPQLIKGVVFIDPLSANDSHYKEVLTPKEQKQSGFDKTGNLVIMKHLSILHLGFVIKAFMKKAPPFYYYHDFSKEAKEYILTAITLPSLYTSSLEEYQLSHMEQYTFSLKDKLDFPDIPLVLITHNSEFLIKEIIEFGRASSELAAKVEKLWQSLMKEYLTFSSVNHFVQAKNSGHYIHLTEPKLIEDGLFWIERNVIQ